MRGRKTTSAEQPVASVFGRAELAALDGDAKKETPKGEHLIVTCTKLELPNSSKGLVRQ
jgi:hypothetical protein